VRGKGDEISLAWLCCKKKFLFFFWGASFEELQEGKENWQETKERGRNRNRETVEYIDGKVKPHSPPRRQERGRGGKRQREGNNRERERERKERERMKRPTLYQVSILRYAHEIQPT
jgi:hypothetical protein